MAAGRLVRGGGGWAGRAISRVGGPGRGTRGLAVLAGRAVELAGQAREQVREPVWGGEAGGHSGWQVQQKLLAWGELADT
jgi:hypothetical protein